MSSEGANGNGDGNGNGDRGSMHPEAVQALAEETAVKQSADEQWIQRVDDRVAAIYDGATPWQRDITAKLTLITNQILILTQWRGVIRPSLWVIGTIGAFSALGELLYRLVTK